MARRTTMPVVALLLASVVGLGLIVLSVASRDARPLAVPTMSYSEKWEVSRTPLPPPPPEGTATPLFDPESDVASSTWEWIAVTLAGAGVLAVLVCLALLVRRLVALRLSARRRREHGRDGEVRVLADVDAEELVDSFRATIHRLRSGGSVDDAIVECWLALESVAARQGVERRPSQTADEYTVDVLAGTAARRDDMATLADLYRAAMFSSRTPTAADRERAVAALEHLVDALTGASSRSARSAGGTRVVAERARDGREEAGASTRSACSAGGTRVVAERARDGRDEAGGDHHA